MMKFKMISQQYETFQGVERLKSIHFEIKFLIFTQDFTLNFEYKGADGAEKRK
jgi:hypothetical protein